jgi:hypothetical protein
MKRCGGEKKSSNGCVVCQLRSQPEADSEREDLEADREPEEPGGRVETGAVLGCPAANAAVVTPNGYVRRDHQMRRTRYRWMCRYRRIAVTVLGSSAVEQSAHG